MNYLDKNNPLVSVIIPTYNQSNFIGDAIKSVLEQSYPNLELIIIDNYSEDDTEKIVRSFSDQRVQYFKFSNNGIISASRNFGITKSRGEYIAFLDSDDIWLKDKIVKQIELFNKDSLIGLTFCPFKIISTDSLLNGRVLGFNKKKILGHHYEQLICNNFIISSSAMVRTSVIKELGGFDEAAQLRCVEDGDLWLRIARKYKIANIPEVKGIYRIHSINLSMDGQRLQRVFTLLEKHFKNGWIDERTFKKAKTHYYLREGWSLAGKQGKSARTLFYAALHEDRHNLKMCFSIFSGILLSLIPPLCRVIKKKSLDKSLADLLL